MKHTPGPWQVVGGTLATHSVITKNPPSGHYDIICDAPEYSETAMEQWPANAKLIAAAPDLLAALISARDELAKHIVFREYPELITQINDAINKATTK